MSDTAPGVVARALIVLIGWYQAARAGRPSPCRYWPSCSTYARQAVEFHGARRGSWLAIRRLAHCHPLGGSGIDLVPDAVPGSRVRGTAFGPRRPGGAEGP